MQRVSLRKTDKFPVTEFIGGVYVCMKGVTLLSAKAANVLYPLLFSLCTAVAVFVFIWLMVRCIGKKDVPEQGDASTTEASPRARAMDATAVFLLFLVIGLVLRLIFVFAVKGNRTQVSAFTTLFEYVKANGFGEKYYSENGLGLYPVPYYLYAFMGVFYKLFNLTPDSSATALFTKLPLIAADLVTAYLLYKMTRKYLNSSAAVVVGAFVCVCPLCVFASSVWASVYSIPVMFTVLTLYFVVQKNMVATIGCYAAALLTHRSALYLFPPIAVFVIYGLVKACIAVHNDRGVTFAKLLHDPDKRAVFTVPVSIVGFTIVSYLVSLPVMIGSYGAGFFTYLYRLFFKPLATFDSFGQNSLGIFNLFMRNGKLLTARFPSVIFTVLFAAIITAIVLLVYLSKKNRANLVFLCGYILFTLATYFVGFDEFGLLTATALFLMSFLLIRDKRIVSVWGMLTLLVVLNASVVMAQAGYYNNSVAYEIGEVSLAQEILSGGGKAVNIICSALAVLTHLYATVILLDISMSGKRKVLPYRENATFGKAMQAYFARIEK